MREVRGGETEHEKTERKRTGVRLTTLIQMESI